MQIIICGKIRSSWGCYKLTKIRLNGIGHHAHCKKTWSMIETLTCQSEQSSHSRPAKQHEQNLQIKRIMDHSHLWAMNPTLTNKLWGHPRRDNMLGTSNRVSTSISGARYGDLTPVKCLYKCYQHYQFLSSPKSQTIHTPGPFVNCFFLMDVVRCWFSQVRNWQRIA